MKILVTGTTAKQVGSDRAFQIALNSGTLVHYLQQGGHEVDWRGVIPGEDLSSYDKVIVYVGAPNALGSSFIYGVLYTLVARPDAMVALDDWRSKLLRSGARTILKSGIDSLFKEAVPRKHREEGRANQEFLHQGLRELAGEVEKQRTCFTPLFRRGNPAILDMPNVSRHVIFDPTLLWIDKYNDIVKDIPEVKDVSLKEKKWIHAALTKNTWLEKQPFTWPVDMYGLRSLKHPRIPEKELIQIMAKSWGIISVPYPDYEGGGGWRVRFSISSVCKSVIYGDPKELDIVYGPGNYTRHLVNIENKSVQELEDLYQKQNQALYAQLMPHEECINIINEGVING